MHWFKFIAFIKNVGECPLTQKISYRVMKLDGMSGDMLEHYKKLKKSSQIKTEISREEYMSLLELKYSGMSEYERNYYIEYAKQNG